MQQMFELEKPLLKNNFRRKLGKEYYILKRKVDNLFSKEKFSKQLSENLEINQSVFKHSSMILRPLKDVEMYLQFNKKKNLELAIKKLDNTIIYPNETFSLWNLVGKPTAKKGYLEGLILNQGKIDKGIGGGLCQLGNLLFWIFAHSPLLITERHRHSFDVFPDVNRKVPFGAGATLSYNYIDFRVKNNTENTFKIKLWIENDYLFGQLFSLEKLNSTYKIEEKNHIVKQQFWGGYSRHNQIFKIETDEFGNSTESLLIENHALMMYNPFLENKKS